MGWPQDGTWAALEDGTRLRVDGGTWRLAAVDCGELVLPSGRLVACDPFVSLERGGNPFVRVPAGRHRVVVTIADVSGREDASHLREAYATLRLPGGPELTRRVLTPLQEGEAAEPLGDDEYHGFGVDAGTACLVDDEATAHGMPDPAEVDWHWDLGENIVLIHSGWGDGYYPLVGGYDAAGGLVAVHIDFGVVDPDAERLAGSA